MGATGVVAGVLKLRRARAVAGVRAGVGTDAGADADADATPASPRVASSARDDARGVLATIVSPLIRVASAPGLGEMSDETRHFRDARAKRRRDASDETRGDARWTRATRDARASRRRDRRTRARWRRPRAARCAEPVDRAGDDSPRQLCASRSKTRDHRKRTRPKFHERLGAAISTVRSPGAARAEESRGTNPSPTRSPHAPLTRGSSPSSPSLPTRPPRPARF